MMEFSGLQRAYIALSFQLPAENIISLDWFHSTHAAFLCRYSMVLASLISWGFQGNLSFMITALSSGLSGPPYRNSNPATHCLASVALWYHDVRL